MSHEVTSPLLYHEVTESEPGLTLGSFRSKASIPSADTQQCSLLLGSMHRLVPGLTHTRCPFGNTAGKDKQLRDRTAACRSLCRRLPHLARLTPQAFPHHAKSVPALSGHSLFSYVYSFTACPLGDCRHPEGRDHVCP